MRRWALPRSLLRGVALPACEDLAVGEVLRGEREERGRFDPTPEILPCFGAPLLQPRPACAVLN